MSFFEFPRRHRRPGPLSSAGLIAIALFLCAAPSRATTPIPLYSNAQFANQLPGGGRSPLRSFATENGVYEFDSAIQSIRAWSFDDKYYAQEISSDARPTGTNESRWNNVKDMFKFPGENKVAVLNACPYLPLLGKKPSLDIYSFEETTSGGFLTGVEWTFESTYNDMESFRAALVGALGPDAATLSLANARAFASLGGNVWAVALCVEKMTISGGNDTIIVIMNGFGEGAQVSSVFQISAGPTMFTSVADGQEHVGGVKSISALSMTADPETKSIYIADEDRNCVYRFDGSGGNYTENVDIYDDQMNDPWECVLLGSVNVAMPDKIYGESEVSGVAGMLSRPTSLQVWQMPLFSEKLLLVANNGGNTVAALGVEKGSCVFEFDDVGANPGQICMPTSAWGSPDGDTIVVSDQSNARVQMFSCAQSHVEMADESIVLSGLPATKVPVQKMVEIGGVMVPTEELEDEFIIHESSITPWDITLTVVPSLTNRTFEVSVTTEPADCAYLTAAKVDIAAGETSGMVQLYATDGVAGGTTGKLLAKGALEASLDFTITNVPPNFFANMAELGRETLRADPTALGSIKEAVNLIGDGTETVSKTLHADAFDTDKDPIVYDWYIFEPRGIIVDLDEKDRAEGPWTPVNDDDCSTEEKNYVDGPWFEEFDKYPQDYFEEEHDQMIFLVNEAGKMITRRAHIRWNLVGIAANGGADHVFSVPAGERRRIAVRATDKDGGTTYSLTERYTFFINLTNDGEDPEPSDKAVLAGLHITSFASNPADNGATALISYTVYSSNGKDYTAGDYTWWTLQSNDLLGPYTKKALAEPTNLPLADGTPVENSATIELLGDGTAEKCFVKILAEPNEM